MRRVRSLDLPGEPGVAYLAGEVRACQAVRGHLVGERGWSRRDVVVKPFWTPGRRGMDCRRRRAHAAGNPPPPADTRPQPASRSRGRALTRAGGAPGSRPRWRRTWPTGRPRARRCVR
ncbi:SIP domain-containing protein [Microtetraspora malaysiensis]|uniref:SIP domain-containing protein n=1 Tax=Microtetraspora malaysiensis TaxID=161358 RepID=UPI003D8ECBF0